MYWYYIDEFRYNHHENVLLSLINSLIPIIVNFNFLRVKESYTSKNMKSHMTLFWGDAIEILFPGWPGSNFNSYMLALALVFVLSLAVEWLSHTKFIKPTMDNITAGILQTAMYAFRVGMAYLVMLAVMSYNLGILLAAVAGYTIGFLIFGSRAFDDSKISKISPCEDPADLPPLIC